VFNIINFFIEKITFLLFYIIFCEKMLKL